MAEKVIRRICVFSGSSPGAREVYAEHARLVGRALASRGIGLVYGGGSLGLMGVMADAALASGGEVVGVIPHALATKERAHQGASELRVVSSMHERKALMAELSDAFIALPGGFGTYEELFEVITWAQLGLHQKPIGVLNAGGYFDALTALIEQAIEEGFIQARYRQLVTISSSVEELLDSFAHHQPPPSLIKWLDLEET